MTKYNGKKIWPKKKALAEVMFNGWYKSVR